MIEVLHFFHPLSNTLTYLIFDPKTKDALVIDPVLDYHPRSSQISYESCDAILQSVEKKGLILRLILDTHIHADHLSGAASLQMAYPEAPYLITEKITVVQETFGKVFDLKGFATDGSQFDGLFKPGEDLKAGSISVKTFATPGHTPACTSLLIDDHLFTGDTMFMPDFGTGRCDFPGGDAGLLYDSIQMLYELPDATNVYVGHDYQPGGRELKFRTTIGESKTENIQLKGGTSRSEFVTWRTDRDKTLDLPNLLWQSVQFNMMAGKIEGNGGKGLFFKIPVYGLTSGG